MPKSSILDVLRRWAIGKNNEDDFCEIFGFDHNQNIDDNMDMMICSHVHEMSIYEVLTSIEVFDRHD